MSNLNPKEIAEKLVESYYLCMPFKDVKLTSCNETPKLIVDMEKLSAKQCALTSVENEIKSIMWLNILCTFDNPMKSNLEKKIEELKQVKTEIENL